MGWIDDLPAGERAALRDAGRLGATRFEGPDQRYAEHRRMAERLARLFPEMDPTAREDMAWSMSEAGR